ARLFEEMLVKAKIGCPARQGETPSFLADTTVSALRRKFRPISSATHRKRYKGGASLTTDFQHSSPPRGDDRVKTTYLGAEA
ncbi:TPA: hypothetical protein ACQWIS_000490, partial [Edwardsiella piscicida]